MACTVADFQGVTQPQAQAYYACQYFEAVKDTNLYRNIIAGVQAVTQIYFADKQYEIAKQAQDRLDADATINRERSGITFGQFTKGIACEDALREEACAEVIPAPNIEDVRRMAEASVKRAYSPIRKKIADCTPVHCMAAACDQLANLAMKEARDIAALTQQLWRQEMARWDTRVAASRSFKYQMLGLGRGYVGSSTALMQGASLNTQAAAAINPYSGAIQAVNSIASTARSITLQEANNFAGMMALNTGNGMSTNRTTSPPLMNGSQVVNYFEGDTTAGERAMYQDMSQYNNFSDPSTFYSDGNIGGDTISPSSVDPFPINGFI